MILLLALSMWARADWSVTRLKGGDAWLQQGVHRLMLQEGARVADDELIATGPGARLELRQGTARLNIGGNTRVQLKPLARTADDPLKLIYGKVRALVKPESGQGFHIETPAAVAGVRGTEFFVDAGAGRDFVCTLDGSVEVRAKSTGQTVSVPAGLGVAVSDGRPLSVEPTPFEQADRWVNDTGGAEFRPVVRDDYPRLDVRFHRVHPNLELGFHAHMNLAHLRDLGDSNAPAPDHNEILQLRLSPALRFNDRGRTLTWIPRLLAHVSSQEMPLDAFPRVVERNYARADLGELFAEASLLDARIRGGQQSLKWTDGSLFSFNFWSLDPYLFRGLRVNRAFARHHVEAIGFLRGDAGELNGQVRAGILGLKYDFANWLSLFAVQREFESGPRIRDAGFYSNPRVGRMDAKVSYIGQNDPGAGMFEGGFGVYPLDGANWRLGFAYIDADRDFVPGFESPYNLGYSQTLTRRNLRQYRARVSFAPVSSVWSGFIEWIESRRRQGDVKLASEVDLSVAHELGTQFRTLATIFSLDPSGAPAGWGAVINVQYSY